MSEQSKNSNRLAPVKRETGANPVRTRHRDREQEPQNHWETGKMADAMILSRETCLNAVQKRKICKIDRDIDFADLFVCGSFSDNGSERSLSFCMHFIIFLMTAGKIMVGSKSFLAALYLI